MIGRLGIWSSGLRRNQDDGAVRDAAVELEELGYGALFIPGGVGGDDLFPSARRLLDATGRMTVATGVANIWMHAPEAVAGAYADIEAAHPERLLAGLGISHAPLIDRSAPGRYRKPLSTMRAYLDDLDSLPRPVPDAGRLLGALGPRMLELARDRTAGAHTYFVTVEHTRFARAILGPDRLLAVELAVVLDTDATTARATAREHMQIYLGLPNYVNALLRHGLDQADLLHGGSDHAVDSVVAWGDVDAIGRQVAAHHEAGADHVCLQVVGAPGDLPRDAWRELAALA